MAAQIRKENGIVDPNTESADVTINVSAEKGAALSRYVDAKNRYIQARKILENVELTLGQERLRTAARVLPPVKIWERAEAPAHPSTRGFFGLFDGWRR